MQDLPPTLLKVLNLGYLFLPLGLALVGGLCLLIAAARKTLTGGTALALGGLCGLIVAGSVSLGAVERTAEAARAPAAKAAPAATVATTGAQPASVPAPAAAGEAKATTPAKSGALSARTYRWASMGYAILPLALAALAGLALLIAVFGKTLNGASALGLGGLCGVVVLGSALGLHGTAGKSTCPLGFGDRGEVSEDVDGAAPVVNIDAEQDQQILRVHTGLETMKIRVDALQKAADQLGQKSDRLLEQNGNWAGTLKALTQHLSSLDQQVSDAGKAAATADAKADAAKAAADAAAAKADVNRAPSSAPKTTPPSAPAPGPGGNGGGQ